MARWLLLGLAAVTVILGVVMWMGLREPAPSGSAVAKSPPPAPAKAVAPQVAERGTLSEPSKQTADTPEKPPKHTEEELAREHVERFLAGAVVQELYAVAAHCYPQYQGEARLHEAIEVRYRVRVTDGSASVSEASLVKSGVADRALEDCVVAAVGKHTWGVSPGFTVDEPNETASFTLRGLKKRAPRQDSD